MKHSSLRTERGAGRRVLAAALRASCLGAAVAAVASCHALDTTRQPGPNMSLGDDIYGVFCDRVGASSIPEDLSGSSYNGICHPDASGQYGDAVDVSVLPPAQTAEQVRARKLSVAKLERMAQRRKDLIHALNAALPDTEIADPKNPGQKVRLHDALMSLAQGLTPLYESNPFDKKADPLMPSQTRAMARLFDAFGAPGTCAQGGKACSWNADCGTSGVCVSEPRDTLSGIWARRGYRPFQVGLGAVRPGLGYPELRTLTKSTLAVLGPGGSASSELQQALTVAHQELLTAAVVDAAKAPLSIDDTLGQPSRPREDMEFLQALMLTESPAFQATSAGTPMYVARRDRRGFVVPAGNTPGVPGTVMAPFVDLGNDGYADVDSFGRFVDAAGVPLDLEPPFGIPGTTTGSIDQFGRSTSASSRYSYLDTSQTLVGGLTRHLLPLLDPTVITTGDPKPWEQEHEAVMYAMAGAYALFGDRADASYDYKQEGAAGGVVSYRRFKAEDSPIPDLVHAAGQVLADPDSDALLASLVDLLQNHEPTVARLMGAALDIREISKKHDTLAAQGTEKAAELAYSVTLWDEMADLVSDMAKHPGLLERLIKALADDTAVTQFGNSDHMGDAMSRFLSYRDEMTYNPYGRHFDGSPGGINGPAINLTIGGGSIQDPQTPVDRGQPQTGKNASCMQRSLRLIHDSNGGPACNRDGAKVAASLFGTTVNWPLVGSYTECELFQFDNLTLFYLDSLLPSAHPKRSFLKIKASGLNTLMSFLGAAGASVDDLLEQSADITGLTQHPSPQALNRLVWFGASTQNYPAMPDADFVNQGKQVDKFVSGTIDPVSVATCPPDAMGAPTCSDNAHTLRIQAGNTIVLWERFGFTQYLQPVVQAFAGVACTPDLSSCDTNHFEGEKLLVRLFDLLNKHWPGPDHGSECSSDATSADHCPGSGLNRYEPLLADAFLSDIIPALHEFSKVATDLSKITVRRGPKAGQTWTGAQVLEKLTTVLFSKDYAAGVGMKDRKGNAQTTWTDGSHPQQVTVYSLFADALHKMDTRWVDFCDCTKKTGADQASCQQNLNACLADADARKAQWKRARSLLVDEFLAVDGAGPGAAFHNPTVTPTLLATLGLAREQVNAHCQDREQTGGAPCTWASHDLGQKLNDVMSRPLFAALVDVTEKIRADEGARRQLEAFLQYALGGDPQALQGMLSSIADLLQVLVDDKTLTPILKAGAPGMSPDADAAGAGAASLGIQMLKAVVDDKVDPYHVMDHVLPLLVTPMDDGKGLAPIEIFMDVIADVNRVDAADTGPMQNDDYQGVMTTMQGFMTDKTRGLEQLYTIIQRRPKQ
jgi:hypothetical protein